MLGLSLFLIVLLIFQDLLLLVLLVTCFKDYNKGFKGSFPKITILIPCRNEAENLHRCLKALDNLNYPMDQLQVIVGDDRSSDKTGQILAYWAKEKSFAKFLAIQGTFQGSMNGKANALHQMIQEATGEFYLFTDADCAVPQEWAKSMVRACLTSRAGIVTGITKVEGNSLFSRMQGLDWWLTLGMVKVMDDIGIAVTSMGNNMLVSKEAYESVGGFPNIPFSLTEDFELARQIKRKGFSLCHQVGESNLILTKSQPNFKDLLMQRKRWMEGAMGLPLFWKVVLAIQVLFFPAILSFLILFPLKGFFIWLCKVLIQSGFIYLFGGKTGDKLRISDFLIFEIYYGITAWSTIVYYFWPSKTVWKGRKY